MKGPLNLLTFSLLGIILSFASCKKDEAIRPRFVSGEVLFQVYDSVSFYSTTKLFDSLQLKIKEANDFEYFIKTTTDSVDTIESILRSKSYLTNGGRTFSVLYLSDTLRITANFYNIDDTAVSDWLNTVTTLNLNENLIGSHFKNGILIVPIGQEHHWIDELKKYGIIKAVELNGIIYI